jgi:hypothetical protein
MAVQLRFSRKCAPTLPLHIEPPVDAPHDARQKPLVPDSYAAPASPAAARPTQYATKQFSRSPDPPRDMVSGRSEPGARAESCRQLRVAEAVAEALHDLRQDALAGEEHVGHLAEGEA